MSEDEDKKSQKAFAASEVGMSWLGRNMVTDVEYIGMSPEKIITVVPRITPILELLREWSDLAVDRTTPALFGLFSRVTMAEHDQHGPPQDRYNRRP